MYTREQIKKFMEKLEKSPGGCHVWTGARKPTGYGNLKISGEHKIAHRVAYEINNGPIPDGLVVMHICDNPPCCNPLHLVLGTRKQNTRDMIRKSRHGFYKNRASGDRNGMTKIPDRELKNIINRYRSGDSQQEIADDYGVSQATISRIVIGRRKII